MHKIDTKTWTVDKNVDELHPAIVEAAERLKQGEVIAFPTETVYGLGANALETAAVKKIFAAKGRPSDNPLIVHIASTQQLSLLIDEELSEKSKRLIEEFWPGPLTIIFKRKEGISELVTAGLVTVAVRMPDHPVALSILKAANLPIAAPSANRSGKPSPTTADHVKQDLDGLIDGIVDGGSTGIGIESTVIDMTGIIPTILRPGGITLEQLQQVLGQVTLDPAIQHQQEKPRSPGMKYTHYAPLGEMWIVQGEEHRRIEQMKQLIEKQIKLGKKVGILTIEEHKDYFPLADSIIAYGSKDNLYPMAEQLYQALRTFDIQGVDFILTESVDESGIGLAIMNRLRKAAGHKIIDVDNL